MLKTCIDVTFGIEVFIHNNLTPSNIKLTQNSAGLIGFDYGNFEDLNENYLLMTLPLSNDREAIANLSDIPQVVSNVRNFEIATLYDYIINSNKYDALNTFKTYLTAKSKYYEKMGENAYSMAEDNNETLISCYELADKYMAHSKLLSNPTKDIIKSEAIKIQIAKYVYAQDILSDSEKNKINPNQIYKYMLAAKDYFIRQYIEADTNKKRLYYKDCLDLFKSWDNLSEEINIQLQRVNAGRFRVEEDEYEDALLK